MKVKICLLIEKDTIEHIVKNTPPSVSFTINCHARYEGGQLNISATEDGSIYESKTREQFILSTEHHDPKGII